MGERGAWPSEASNKDTEIHFWLAVAVGGFETCPAKATAKICLLGARHRVQTNIRSNSECQVALVRKKWWGGQGSRKLKV